MASKTNKADVRLTPATLAVLMTDAPDAPHGLGLGRNWTPSDGAKRVRSIARDTIDRFVNRTGRTMHAYTVDEARAIVDEARRATGGGTGVSVDEARTVLSGQQTARKASAPRKPSRKAAPAPKAADDQQDVS